MSRAFVKESEQDAVVLPPWPELPDGAANRITPAGARALADELAAARAERDALAGDDGAVARARRAHLDARIGALEQRLPTHVVTPVPDDPERVSFGATVVLADADGAERTWQIVGVDEADPAAGRVSWASPLARAVLGARAGDTVRLRRPGGEEELEVVAVRGDAG